MVDDGRRYWERHAKNYDRSMRVLGGPVPRMVHLTAEAVRGAHRVLEVASGTGLLTVDLARTATEVVATDYAERMVEATARRVEDAGLGNVRCRRADLYALPFEPRSFEAVVAANVLHLVPDLARALTALLSMLVPGGTLVVPTYCHDETVLSRIVSRGLALTWKSSQRRFTAQSLRTALSGAGARDVRGELLPGVIPILYVEARAEAAQRPDRTTR